MKTIFLTSSPTGPLDGARWVDGIDDKNQFYINLKKYWKADARCVIISAFPENDPANDEMRAFFEETFNRRGLTSSVFDVWDCRTEDVSEGKLLSYDVIFLGGGHVPTQNEFFHEINLPEKIQKYNGMIIGISAGTMNSAEVVYVQPEEPGESVDPEFVRFVRGLGLTKTQILPHYQMVKDNYLDGRRLYEDITYGDSWNQRFLVLVDGSYLFITRGQEVVYGEAYVIADGAIRQICEEDQTFRWA